MSREVGTLEFIKQRIPINAGPEHIAVLVRDVSYNDVVKLAGVIILRPGGIAG